MRVAVLVAARPNFVKTAPLIRALEALGVDATVVHAGQHYDNVMSEAFLRDLDIPWPAVNLGVGSGSHGHQTAATILGVEQFLCESTPDAIVVAGDVNATMGGAIAGAKAGIPVVHLEAGLRSFDRSMPEEINRVVTDHLSHLCLAPSRDAVENLAREGIIGERVALVGNCMIDTLLEKLEEARARRIWEKLGLRAEKYAVLTLHRPSNVDDANKIAELVQTVLEAATPFDVVFPMHPRTAKMLRPSAISASRSSRLMSIEPLGYIDFLSLLISARIVFTDSGGIQEETSVLGVPCVTLRNNTERPITISLGTNHLGGTRRESILQVSKEALESPYPNPKTIPLWDGKSGTRAARKVVELIEGLTGRHNWEDLQQ